MLSLIFLIQCSINHKEKRRKVNYSNIINLREKIREDRNPDLLVLEYIKEKLIQICLKKKNEIKQGIRERTVEKKKNLCNRICEEVQK
jgi:hypothetical protein